MSHATTTLLLAVSTCLTVMVLWETAAQSSPVPMSGTTSSTGQASGTSAPMVRPGASAAALDTVIARAAEVLAGRCAACHGAHEPAAGIRADTPDALREAQGGVRWVTPGRPDESRLFEVVGGLSTAGRAVAPKHRLNESEVDALRAWIASLTE